MKIAINTCYGGFSLSEEALALYKEYAGVLPSLEDEDRSDPLLIRVIEQLGTERAAAKGRGHKLKIIDIPEGVEWEIRDKGGIEIVVEKHRSWF